MYWESILVNDCVLLGRSEQLRHIVAVVYEIGSDGIDPIRILAGISKRLNYMSNDRKPIMIHI